MRKRTKNKTGACGLCKPHKSGWEKRWRPRELALLAAYERGARASSIALLFALCAACSWGGLRGQLDAALGTSAQQKTRYVSFEEAPSAKRSRSSGFAYVEGKGEEPMVAVATLNEGKREVRTVAVTACPGLKADIDALFEAMARSARTIVDRNPELHTDTIVPGVSWYELVYTDDRYGTLTLSGTSETSVFVPWVIEGRKALERAGACGAAEQRSGGDSE